MRFLKRLYENALEILALIAFTSLIFLTFLQVLSRYVFQTPITFTEEMGRFLFIWISFLGAAIVMKHDKHIRLDLLQEKVHQNVRSMIDIMVFLLIFAFSALVFFQGIKLVSATSRQIAPVSRIPMSYIYLNIPISAFFICLYSIGHIISKIQKAMKRLKSVNRNSLKNVR